jgi:hypothetical protein
MAGMSRLRSSKDDSLARQAQELRSHFERDIDRRTAYRVDDYVWVESVSLEGVFPVTELVLILRRASRPTCRYGFRARVWNDEGRLMSDEPGGWNTVEGYAGILGIHLDEIVHAAKGGLPDDCAEDEVVWPVDRLGGTFWGLGTDLPRFPPLATGHILLLRSPFALAKVKVVEVLDDGRVRAEVWDHTALRAVERLIDRNDIEKSFGTNLARSGAGSTPPGPEQHAIRAWLDDSG